MRSQKMEKFTIVKCGSMRMTAIYSWCEAIYFFCTEHRSGCAQKIEKGTENDGWASIRATREDVA
jgi:hypothetical protein